MSRKVLFSFLGNRSYLPCRYEFQGRRSEVVQFVQTAMVQLCCQDWTTTDKVYIFLTSEAEKNNWKGALYEHGGLAKALQKYTHLSVEIIQNIPSGNTEGEIWELFEILYKHLDPKDEVYLDITNGFRSLPMLFIVLLNYAKALKDIQIKQISYGAFEVLGGPISVKENYPNPKDRVVPILDLTSFAALQDWTLAAFDFKAYGEIQRLTDLSSLTSILKHAQAEKETTKLLQQINDHIQTLIPLLQTNRGKKLGMFDFDALNHLLPKLAQNLTVIRPLTAIIEEIQQKIQPFHNEDSLFWLKATEWCLQHQLIQQGITQLQEGYVTWLCFRFREQLQDDFFIDTHVAARDLIKGVFTILEKNIPRNKWRRQNKKYVPRTRQLMEDAIIQQSVTLFSQISTLRNDINHGGYTKDTSAAHFKSQFANYLKLVSTIVTTGKSPVVISKNNIGLLNFSHHPFAKWPPKQSQLAIQKYSQVTDFKFPNIAPTATSEEVADLVEQYYRQIKKMRPMAVHLMGEMTFTFALVQRLKAIGITCLAATRNRPEKTNEQEGEDFDFVGFREY